MHSLAECKRCVCTHCVPLRKKKSKKHKKEKKAKKEKKDAADKESQAAAEFIIEEEVADAQSYEEIQSTVLRLSNLTAGLESTP